MLTSFRVIKNHPIKRLHRINTDIINVLCTSKIGADFQKLQFKKETAQLLNSEKAQETDYLFKQVELLHTLISKDDKLKKSIKTAFIANNKIEDICRNNLTPYYYEDFPPKVRTLLKEIYFNLYNHIFGRATCVTLCNSSLETYFHSLTHRKINFCPFCGLAPLTSKYEGGRDAFDHYLPKSKYPFNSVNMENLFPMCYICNSKNKGSKDLIYHSNRRSPKNRRKAFYPFDSTINIKDLTLKVIIKNQKINLRKINPDKDIELKINFKGREEEKEQWDRVFGITKRYKGRIQEDIIDWLTLLYTDYTTYRSHFTSRQIIEKFIQKMSMQPLVDKQFLKVAFFEALHAEKILEKTIKNWRV
jgi:hypothetical protein